MTNTVRRNLLACLMITLGIGLSQAAQAASYNPVTQQAQSKLKSLGLDPGPLDGVAGGGTRTAVQAFHRSVDVAGKTLITNIEAGSFPNFNGISQKRIIVSLTADEMRYTNPATSIGVTTDAVWKRAK